MSIDTSRAPISQTGTRSRTFGTTWLNDTERTRARSRGRRLKRWWRRNRRQLKRTWRRTTQTITPVGWFVFAATVLSAILGGTLGWVEAWFVAIVALGLITKFEVL